MKKSILAILLALFSITLYAQLKPTVSCPEFVVDILDGKIGALIPTSSNGEIKGKFPCFSSTEEETGSSACGGSVMFKDKDIYFYTGRDYIEIREKFKGKLTVPLMGAARSSLFKTLGHPKMKDAGWEAYQMAYGTMVLYFNKSSKVNKIQITSKSTANLQLCE